MTVGQPVAVLVFEGSLYGFMFSVAFAFLLLLAAYRVDIVLTLCALACFFSFFFFLFFLVVILMGILRGISIVSYISLVFFVSLLFL